MKIIPLHQNKSIEQLVSRLRKQDRLAQRDLYDKYAGKMLAICRTYINDISYAEDALIKGFMKVFKNIDKYEFKGNFEGWMRRIMVNECLDFIRSYKRPVFWEENLNYEEPVDDEVELQQIDAMDLLDLLPENYRLVFNLYVLEDYSHKEIGELLNISESSSKTLLFRSKNKLKEIILSTNERKNEKK